MPLITKSQEGANSGGVRVGGVGNYCMVSDWSKVGRNQLKARQSRTNHLYLGLFVPKFATMSAWPIAGLLVCVLYLISVCNCFWNESDQVYLISAKPPDKMKPRLKECSINRVISYRITFFPYFSFCFRPFFNFPDFPVFFLNNTRIQGYEI